MFIVLSVAQATVFCRAGIPFSAFVGFLCASAVRRMPEGVRIQRIKIAIPDGAEPHPAIAEVRAAKPRP